jgi:DNA-binding CsgD family transcriptional regulator
MIATGSCAPGPYSSDDYEVPLPVSVPSGRDVFDDLARLDKARARLSPVQIQYLDPVEAEELLARTNPKARRRPSTITSRHLSTSEVVGLHAAGMTATQIGRKLGFDPNSIRYHLSLAGVIAPRDGRLGPQPHTARPKPDPAQIVAAYQAGESVNQISARLGHNHRTITRHLTAAGITRRDDTHRGGGNNRIPVTPRMLADLRRLYETQGRSMEAVSALMGIGETKVRRMLVDAGIPRRTRGSGGWRVA